MYQVDLFLYTFCYDRTATWHWCQCCYPGSLIIIPKATQRIGQHRGVKIHSGKKCRIRERTSSSRGNSTQLRITAENTNKKFISNFLLMVNKNVNLDVENLSSWSGLWEWLHLFFGGLILWEYFNGANIVSVPCAVSAAFIWASFSNSSFSVSWEPAFVPSSSLGKREEWPPSVSRKPLHLVNRKWYFFIGPFNFYRGAIEYVFSFFTILFINTSG